MTTNIVNLSDRRKKVKKLPDNVNEIMEEFVDTYLQAAIADLPLNMLIAYAKNAMHAELRSMTFDEAVNKIEQEYPEIACFYKEKLLP